MKKIITLIAFCTTSFASANCLNISGHYRYEPSYCETVNTDPYFNLPTPLKAIGPNDIYTGDFFIEQDDCHDFKVTYNLNRDYCTWCTADSTSVMASEAGLGSKVRFSENEVTGDNFYFHDPLNFYDDRFSVTLNADGSINYKWSLHGVGHGPAAKAVCKFPKVDSDHPTQE